MKTNLMAKEEYFVEKSISLNPWEIYPAIIQKCSGSIIVIIELEEKIFSMEFSKEKFKEIFSEVSIEMAQGKSIPMRGFRSNIEIISNTPLPENTNQIIEIKDLGEHIMMLYTEHKIFIYKDRYFNGFFAKGKKKPIEGETIIFEIWNGDFWTPWIESEASKVLIIKKKIANYYVLELESGKRLVYKLVE